MKQSLLLIAFRHHADENRLWDFLKPQPSKNCSMARDKFEGAINEEIGG